MAPSNSGDAGEGTLHGNVRAGPGSEDPSRVWPRAGGGGSRAAVTASGSAMRPPSARPGRVAVVKTVVRPPSYGEPRGFTWPSLHSHKDPHAPRARGGKVGP